MQNSRSTSDEEEEEEEEDEFKDALDDDDEEEDEDDDYFQDEDAEESKKKKEMDKLKAKAIEQDKKRNTEKSEPIKVEPVADAVAVVEEEQEKKEEETVKKPSRMSFILPALQNNRFSDIEDDSDNDDNESLKDPNEKYEQKKGQQQEQLSADLVSEIEALEVASAPALAPAPAPTPAPVVVIAEKEEAKEEEEEPVPEKSTSKPFEKPATYEPIPNQHRPYKASLAVPAIIEPIISLNTVDTKVEPTIVKEEEVEEKKATMEDIQKEIEKSAAAVGLAAAATIAAVVEIHTAASDEKAAAITQDAPENDEKEFKTMVENATDLNSSDSGISISQGNTARSSESSTSTTTEEQVNHLAAILPAIEESVKNVTSKDKEILVVAPIKKTEIKPEDHERANRSREFEYSIEDPIDLDMFRDNVIAIQAIDAKEIPPNNLKPREQEEAGK